MMVLIMSLKLLLITGDDFEIYHAVQIQSDSPKLIFDDVTGGGQIDISMTLDRWCYSSRQIPILIHHQLYSKWSSRTLSLQL